MSNDDRVDNWMRNHAHGEPYTGDPAPTFLCGHPKTPENTHKAGYASNGQAQFRCAKCNTHRRDTPCATCGEPLGNGAGHTGGYHTEVCEPTTCTCPVRRPNGLGECASCHRLVLSHSWHKGRPGIEPATPTRGAR